jgi:hypothetical protein
VKSPRLAEFDLRSRWRAAVADVTGRCSAGSKGMLDVGGPPAAASAGENGEVPSLPDVVGQGVCLRRP